MKISQILRHPINTAGRATEATIRSVFFACHLNLGLSTASMLASGRGFTRRSTSDYWTSVFDNIDENKFSFHIIRSPCKAIEASVRTVLFSANLSRGKSDAYTVAKAFSREGSRKATSIYWSSVYNQYDTFRLIKSNYVKFMGPNVQNDLRPILLPSAADHYSIGEIDSFSSNPNGVVRLINWLKTTKGQPGITDKDHFRVLASILKTNPKTKEEWIEAIGKKNTKFLLKNICREGFKESIANNYGAVCSYIKLLNADQNPLGRIQYWNPKDPISRSDAVTTYLGVAKNPQYEECTYPELFYAIEADDKDLIKALCNNYSYYNISLKNDKNGWTPLHYAAKWNNVAALNYIVNSKKILGVIIPGSYHEDSWSPHKPFSDTDKTGFTPYMLANFYNHQEAIAIFKNKKMAFVNISDAVRPQFLKKLYRELKTNPGFTLRKSLLLQYRIDTKMMDKLVANDFKGMSCKDGWGVTLRSYFTDVVSETLQISIENDELELFKMVFSPKNKNQLMHKAAYYGSQHILSFLVSNGAEILHTVGGNTILDTAIDRSTHLSIAPVLYAQHRNEVRKTLISTHKLDQELKSIVLAEIDQAFDGSLLEKINLFRPSESEKKYAQIRKDMQNALEHLKPLVENQDSYQSLSTYLHHPEVSNSDCVFSLIGSKAVERSMFTALINDIHKHIDDHLFVRNDAFKSKIKDLFDRTKNKTLLELTTQQQDIAYKEKRAEMKEILKNLKTIIGSSPNYQHLSKLVHDKNISDKLCVWSTTIEHANELIHSINQCSLDSRKKLFHRLPSRVTRQMPTSVRQLFAMHVNSSSDPRSRQMCNTYFGLIANDAKDDAGKILLSEKTTIATTWGLGFNQLVNSSLAL